MTDFAELRLLASTMPCVQVDSNVLESLLDELERFRKLCAPAKRNDYPPEFEEAWAAYPAERQGAKRAVFKAWAANVKRGVEPAEMMLGLRRYLAHAQAIGTETKYLKLAATFFGPDEHFAANYVMPSTKLAQLGKAGQVTASAAEEWLKRRRHG